MIPTLPSIPKVEGWEPTSLRELTQAQRAEIDEKRKRDEGQEWQYAVRPRRSFWQVMQGLWNSI